MLQRHLHNGDSQVAEVEEHIAARSAFSTAVMERCSEFERGFRLDRGDGAPLALAARAGGSADSKKPAGELQIRRDQAHRASAFSIVFPGGDKLDRHTRRLGAAIMASVTSIEFVWFPSPLRSIARQVRSGRSRSFSHCCDGVEGVFISSNRFMTACGRPYDVDIEIINLCTGL